LSHPVGAIKPPIPIRIGGARARGGARGISESIAILVHFSF